MFRQIAPNGIVNKEVHPGAEIDEAKHGSTEGATEKFDETEKEPGDEAVIEADETKKGSQEEIRIETDVAKGSPQEKAIEEIDLETKRETDVEAEKESKQQKTALWFKWRQPSLASPC